MSGKKEDFTLGVKLPGKPWKTVHDPAELNVEELKQAQQMLGPLKLAVSPEDLGKLLPHLQEPYPPLVGPHGMHKLTKNVVMWGGNAMNEMNNAGGTTMQFCFHALILADHAQRLVQNDLQANFTPEMRHVLKRTTTNIDRELARNVKYLQQVRDTQVPILREVLRQAQEAEEGVLTIRLSAEDNE